VEADGRLYALAGCHANVGFENPDRTERVNVRNEDHPFRARRRYHGFCREVDPESGISGPILPLGENTPPPEQLDFSFQGWSNEKVQRISSAIDRALNQSEDVPSWGSPIPGGADSNRLCEPTVYRAADGQYVMLLRDDNYSHRMYASISPDRRHWNTAMPTDIPDSPSLTTSLRLPDDRVLVVGNQMAPQFDNAGEVRHYGRDPLTVGVSPDGYGFEKACALRCGQQQWRTPQSEVRGRGGGAQYPSAVVHDGVLYVQYSMGKEDIRVSSVELSAIMEGK
jgi:hypothetical protein